MSNMGNLAQRILFAVIAIPVVIFLVYRGEWWYWGLTIALSLICYWECSNMLKARGFYTKAALGGYVFILLIFLRAFPGAEPFLPLDLLILALIFGLSIMELIYKDINFSISRLSVSAFCAAYLGLAGFAVYSLGTVFTPGWKLVLPFLVSIWMSDTLAYAAGRLFGSHLLYPAVSPKKTVEGGIGAIAGSTLGFQLLLVINPGLPLYHVIIIGILIGLTGQTGDFIESLMKRWAGVKDSSHLLPGHGGVFDRIDSLLFSAPFVVAYFKYIV